MRKLRAYIASVNIREPRTWVGVFAVLLTLVIATGWQLCTWLYSDDLVYMHSATTAGPDSTFWDAAGPLVDSFSRVPEAVYNHWMTVNGRMSNAAYIVMQPLPVKVVKFFIGVFMGLVMWLLMRLTGRETFSRPWLAVIAVVVFWTGFQWYDTMQSSDFQFNYTLPTAMMLAIIGIVVSGRKLRMWFWILVIIFAPWHECFTILTGIFIGVWWLFHRQRRELWIVIAILVAGFLFTMSPGTMQRMADTPERTIYAVRHIPTYSTLWTYWLALVIWLFRRRRVAEPLRRTNDVWCLAVGATVVIGIIITVMMMTSPRAHWAADALSIVFLLRVLSTFRPRRMSVTVACILTVLYAAWGTSLMVWQHRVTTYTRSLYDNIAVGQSVQFVPQMLTNDDVPFWLMRIVHVPYGEDESFLTYISAIALSRGEMQTYAVLPDSLRGLRFDQWPEIPGTTGFRGVWPTVVRRYDCSRPLEFMQAIVHVEEPGIAMNPIDYTLSETLRALSPVADRSYVRVVAELPFVWMGDSLVTVHFERLPRTRYGRRVVLVEPQW